MKKMALDYSDFNARTKGIYESIWKNTGKCVFCDLREKYIVAQNAHAVLTVSLFPYINGNLLVLPKRHVEDVRDLNSEEWVSIQAMINLGITKLEKVLNTKRVLLYNKNGLKSGGTVAHIHFLLLPNEDGLMNIQPQNITIPPLELAEKLRDLE